MDNSVQSVLNLRLYMVKEQSSIVIYLVTPLRHVQAVKAQE